MKLNDNLTFQAVAAANHQLSDRQQVIFPASGWHSLPHRLILIQERKTKLQGNIDTI